MDVLKSQTLEKFDFKKNVVTTLSNGGSSSFSLSLSLSAISHGPPLSLELSIPMDYTLTVSAYSSIYCLVDRSTSPHAALSAHVMYLHVLAHVAVDENK